MPIVPSRHVSIAISILSKPNFPLRRPLLRGGKNNRALPLCGSSHSGQKRIETPQWSLRTRTTAALHTRPLTAARPEKRSCPGSVGVIPARHARPRLHVTSPNCRAPPCLVRCVAVPCPAPCLQPSRLGDAGRPGSCVLFSPRTKCLFFLSRAPASCQNRLHTRSPLQPSLRPPMERENRAPIRPCAVRPGTRG
ncbi:hypothetical protein CALVIDRAFT_321648 [Calocera viscosa TUFC12733]|uniref:Uncharacterized protein n=1 Tax=Calocera viscosa (strain TUFC12733) TaxID=1330018 RepID=A0A167QMZ4_CALVF|nr:hypothetical protein CALVIDRAFT_321648 [Calocera viscosa TUFC12733]